MSESVYRQIGGKEAVKAVVDDFYERVLSDERLVGYFDGMDMQELRAHQVQFISSVAGGPVDYSADMYEAHAHLDITEADFDAVADHLERALRENGVGDDNVEAIMSEVAALKDPIVAD
ncbi:group I truncated hemoglobin [Halopelagius longus]|uniref:Hemoglobin n=1 Tax=Halopelagius longus TaxID=1236180 RepID=A0A1H1DLS7_9EURY|nr:group 1 truncated hemoglobin [Halopelagius longus]RDI71376.1 group 1 truncated hemoglobin [Halopelagius longus]SDQ77128.1 hemoglobin [Halopelagius longus]